MSKHVDPVKIDVALSTHRFYKDKQAIRFQIFYTFVQKILCHLYIWDWVLIWGIRNET